MRICLVNLDGFPYRSSGLAVYGETLAIGLAELGHRVTVITARRSGLPAHDRFGDIEVLRVAAPLDWMGFSWNAGVLAEDLRRQGFDIIHFADVHFAYHYRGPFVASAFQSFRQRVTSDRGLPYHSNWRGLALRMAYYRVARRLAEAPAVRRAQLILAGSEATAAEFSTHYRAETERMRVVPLGIDLERFQPMPAATMRRDLDLADEDVALLYVGFCTPRKGLEHLARAMGLLPSRVKLVLVGRWEAKYRARFYRTLGDAGDRVIECGYVADEALPLYYNLADVFVFPSLLEGFGLPLAESLACGTPVVATLGSASPEVVGPGGRLVPPRDHEALAAAIRELAGDGDLRRRLGDEGREWVLDRFDRRRMVRETVEAYLEVSRMAKRS
jgi:glycosyltransferase involved in cell wall biosynthesis